ncbi:MAG: prepilin peptidase [Christensenella sp.]|uniref:prepilin peptidase n=1 Tax=Christensenella sp. TaxID=1935934 RepID=UPI002B21EFBF|nr:prepilin peptidase [Christensenella sp.]MEA5002010.1 prepilin peptidase [Christensenella sp.]
MPIFTYFWPFALVFGLVIGSFLNVCICRVPLKQSVATGGSYCPSCGNSLKPIDLVPVLSYVFLRGRCRYCKEKISPQYPLVELLSAGLYILSFYIFGLSWMTLVAWAFVSVLIVASMIDIRTFEIPDGASIALLVIGIACFFLPDTLLWWERLLGALCAAGPLLLIVLLSRGNAMGLGDVKLMAAAGLVLGWKLSLFSLLAAVVIGAVVGVILIASKKKGRKDAIPFVPMLSAGLIAALFWGDAVIAWYISLLGF